MTTLRRHTDDIKTTLGRQYDDHRTTTGRRIDKFPTLVPLTFQSLETHIMLIVYWKV